MTSARAIRGAWGACAARAAGVLARRPAAGAAGVFVCGILLHERLAVSPGVALVWLASLLVVGWISVRRPIICSIVIASALLGGGALTARLHHFYYRDNDIGAYAGDAPRLARLELAIDDPPRILSNPFDGRRSMPPKQVVTARTVRALTWNGWEPCTGELLVQIAQPNPWLEAGQRVVALGMLQRPAPAMNPGQFDWARYYRDQRVLASFSIPHADNITILDEAHPGVLVWSREKVRRLLAEGFGADRALDHALLRALLLGDKDPQLRDVREQFQRTGTSHHLAISGMHVAVLSGFVLGLCRLLRLSPRKAVLVAAGFALVYGLMALPSPPVVRAVALCLSVALGMLFRRSWDTVNLLALAALGILVFQPLDLYQPGFQLSFVTVLGLMLFMKPMSGFLTSARDRDVMLAEDLQPRTTWRAARRWADRAILTTLTAGLVAWGVSMPLIATHFEQLNPWAIVASVALAPLVLLSLCGGLLKVVLTALSPGLSGAWAAMAAAPVEWMRWMVDRLASWPGADVPVPPPAGWVMAGFYLLLLPALLPTIRPGMRWCLRCGRVLGCGAILILPLQRALSSLAPAGETRITLLAIGAGQCAVVTPPSGRTVLIDAGSNSLSDLLNKCLGPYLRNTGCTSVDTVILSHGDYDHVSAVGEVVKAYGVREVLTGAHFRKEAAGAVQTEALLTALDQLERPPRIALPGERTPLGRDTTIEVLWPPREMPEGFAANDASLVLRLTHAGRSILFPGDIQDPAMEELLKNPTRLKSDVLVAPHHGSCESLTPAFVAAVDPQCIISSNDRTLTGKQRDFEQVIGTRPLYRTHTSGAITIILTRNGQMRVEPFLPPERP